MEKVQKDEIQSGWKGVGGMKARVGRDTALAERGPRKTRLNSGGIQAEGVRRGGHSVGRYVISKRSRDAEGRTV